MYEKSVSPYLIATDEESPESPQSLNWPVYSAEAYDSTRKVGQLRRDSRGAHVVIGRHLELAIAVSTPRSCQAAWRLLDLD